MLSTIESVNNVVNNFIWGVPAMICIIGVGLLLSVRTGFIQIRKISIRYEGDDWAHASEKKMPQMVQ